MTPQIQRQMMTFVKIASIFAAKTLQAQQSVREGHEKVASAVPETVKHLTETGVIKQSQQNEAARALNDHARTLELLKNASTTIASLRNQVKMASANAQMGGGQGLSKAASAAQHSPYLGTPAGQESEADARFRERIMSRSSH